MGKRQVRLSSEHLATKLPSLLNQELNMILKNDVTLHGKILRIQSDMVIFKDSILRKHQIPFHSIAEIIIDKQSNY